MSLGTLRQEEYSRRQTEALESIAKSLESIANPATNAKIGDSWDSWDDPLDLEVPEYDYSKRQRNINSGLNPEAK